MLNFARKEEGRKEKEMLGKGGEGNEIKKGDGRKGKKEGEKGKG